MDEVNGIGAPQEDVGQDRVSCHGFEDAYLVATFIRSIDLRIDEIRMRMDCTSYR